MNQDAFEEGFPVTTGNFQQIRQELIDLQAHDRLGMEELLTEMHKTVWSGDEQKTLEELARQSLQCLNVIWQKNREQSSNIATLVHLAVNIIDYISEEQQRSSQQHYKLMQQIQNLKETNDFLQKRNGMIQHDVEYFRQHLQEAEGQLQSISLQQEEREEKSKAFIELQNQYERLQQQLQEYKMHDMQKLQKSFKKSQRSLYSNQQMFNCLEIDQNKDETSIEYYQHQIDALERENIILRNQIRFFHQERAEVYASEKIGFDITEQKQLRPRRSTLSIIKNPSQKLFKVCSFSKLKNVASKLTIKPSQPDLQLEPSLSCLQKPLKLLSNDLSRKSIDYRIPPMIFSITCLDEAQQAPQTKETEESQGVMISEIGVNTEQEPIQTHICSFKKVLQSSFQYGISWCREGISLCREFTVGKRIRKNILRANQSFLQ